MIRYILTAALCLSAFAEEEAAKPPRPPAKPAPETVTAPNEIELDRVTLIRSALKKAGAVEDQNGIFNIQYKDFSERWWVGPSFVKGAEFPDRFLMIETITQVKSREFSKESVSKFMALWKTCSHAMLEQSDVDAGKQALINAYLGSINAKENKNFIRSDWVEGEDFKVKATLQRLNALGFCITVEWKDPGCAEAVDARTSARNK